ncbi:hypothetical protein YC2023_055072 [Brassica napus]
MKMGQDTRELFFYETFLYYNPLLLITMMVWLWDVNLWVFSRTGVDYAAIFYLGPDHHSHKEIWKCARWMTTIILTSMTAYLYLYSHGDVSLAASQPVLEIRDGNGGVEDATILYGKGALISQDALELLHTSSKDLEQ